MKEGDGYQSITVMASIAALIQILLPNLKPCEIFFFLLTSGQSDSVGSL